MWAFLYVFLVNKELISDGYISKSVIVSATSCLTFKNNEKSLSKLFQHFIFSTSNVKEPCFILSPTPLVLVRLFILDIQIGVWWLYFSFLWWLKMSTFNAYCLYLAFFRIYGLRVSFSNLQLTFSLSSLCLWWTEDLNFNEV